jgi:hypothetical protein
MLRTVARVAAPRAAGVRSAAALAKSAPRRGYATYSADGTFDIPLFRDI